MKGDFGHVIDTIIRVSRVPADQADAAALAFTVVKNRHRPETPMSNRLKRCAPHELQIVIPPEKGERWRAMAASWTGEVEPGQYVMRVPNGMDGAAHTGARPDGMVIANKFNSDMDDDRLDQVLVLFFR